MHASRLFRSAMSSPNFWFSLLAEHGRNYRAGGFRLVGSRLM